MPSVIETARWAAAQRARESERRDRLFEDPLATALAGPEGLTALELSEKYNPRHAETANYIAVRIRSFDNIAQSAAVEGVRQIVLLAAGMDARAYRLPWPEDTTFYELDHPELLAAKEEILKKQGAAPHCRRVTIGADLTQDWSRPLLDSGFSAERRSVWIIEGLFYYLTEADVNHVLRKVSSLAAPGSVLVTDLVSRSFLASPWMQAALKAMEEQGMAWKFGTDDPEGLFTQHGWQAEIRDPDLEGAKYNPERFAARKAPGMISFFVFAQRA